MKVIFNIVFVSIFLIIFSSVVNAATVYGNIYDLSLKKVPGARLEVNTTPNQNIISQDGSYSFDAPNGFYTINVKLRKNGISASEHKNITINQGGNYVIDFVLFPNFEEEDDISQELGIIIPEVEEKGPGFPFGLLFVLIIVVLIYFIFKGKKDKEIDIEKEEATKEDGENGDC